MARKTRKGYYVDGVFVAADSEPGQDTPSRTDVKNASEALQDLGVDLLTLRADLLDGLRLPEQLGEAIAEAKRLTHFEAQRRQRQFIGKLMRQLDATALDAIAAALRIQRAQSSGDTRLLHEAEQWRDSLDRRRRTARRVDRPASRYGRSAAAYAHPPGPQGCAGSAGPVGGAAWPRIPGNFRAGAGAPLQTGIIR